MFALVGNSNFTVSNYYANSLNNQQLRAVSYPNFNSKKIRFTTSSTFLCNYACKDRYKQTSPINNEFHALSTVVRRDVSSSCCCLRPICQLNLLNGVNGLWQSVCRNNCPCVRNRLINGPEGEQNIIYERPLQIILDAFILFIKITNFPT